MVALYLTGIAKTQHYCCIWWFSFVEMNKIRAGHELVKPPYVASIDWLDLLAALELPSALAVTLSVCLVAKEQSTAGSPNLRPH
jgi:hypothetical protein